jgi:hypothetical protein
MRCLEKDPKLRYASAKDLAADLQNFLGTPKSSVHMATMSNFLFAVSFSILLINAGVYGLLQGPFSEPVVWGLVFSMYPPIFYFLSYIPRRPGRDNRQALTQLWTMWLGKMFAAICISISLRIVLGDARAAVLMSYPMFAGLSGMILFVMAPQYWSGFYANAIGFWIVGVLMLLNREWAPLEYGAVASIGIAVYGIYVRRVAREYG